MLDLDQIADRMQHFLEDEEKLQEVGYEDSDAAMGEVAKQFADAGLMLDENVPRREEPWIFVQDVMRDNDLMPDYLNLREESDVLQKPALIPSLDNLMSALLPASRD